MVKTSFLDIFAKKTEEYYIVNACYNGDMEYIKEYFSSGKNLNIAHKGNSPLLVAIEQHQVEVIKFLVENGADVNFSSDKAVTALHIAVDSANFQTFDKNAFKEPPTEVIELLIQNGADINVKNKYGLTPIELAKGLATKSGGAPQKIIDLLKKYATE